MSDNNKTFLLTGATGLIGSYLLKILLLNGHRVYVIARSQNGKTAQERVESLLRFWDPAIFSTYQSRMIVLEGDVRHKFAGLKKEKIRLLQKEVQEIYHLAATIEISLPMDVIRKINVQGTRNILELALLINKGGALKKINHVSSVYICGDYRGVFNENSYNVGQHFNTTYEQSKFEAEKIVRMYRHKGLWVDIFRPPLVMGESMTGKIPIYRNIYRFLLYCKLELFDHLPLFGCVVNIAPVDFVAQAIYKISQSSNKRNATYHVFPDFAVPMSRIINFASRILDFHKPRIIPPDKFDPQKCTPAQRIILNKTIFAFNIQATLDSKSTNKLLQKHRLVLKNYSDRMLTVMIGYLRKHKTPLA